MLFSVRQIFAKLSDHKFQMILVKSEQKQLKQVKTSHAGVMLLVNS